MELVSSDPTDQKIINKRLAYFIKKNNIDIQSFYKTIYIYIYNCNNLI